MMEIGFAGFGNMAQSIARGLNQKKDELEFRLYASGRDLSKLERNAAALEAQPVDNETLFQECDIVFICVKPYQVSELLEQHAGQNPDQILISVAAGIEGRQMEQMAQGQGFLCMLPNLPVAINKGVMVIDPYTNLLPDQKKQAEDILSKLGTLVYAADSFRDAAGVVSGCGPAWAAMFLEALADGAVLKGVPRDQARILAAAMVEGTAAMIAQNQIPPAEFKDRVCSPGGTTIRGVKALEDHSFRSGVISAVEASCKK